MIILTYYLYKTFKLRTPVSFSILRKRKQLEALPEMQNGKLNKMFKEPCMCGEGCADSKDELGREVR